MMKLINRTAYFDSLAQAEQAMSSMPAFKPSRFLSAREIHAGAGNAVIREFGCGFAIQLGDCGNYYPATTAD